MSDYIADTVDDLFLDACHDLSRDPDYACAPRGQNIKEILGVSFTLKNPRNRIICNPARAANYGFATGEFLWYLRGAEDVESLSYYNKRTPSFSEDGKTINSAYGHRIFTDCDRFYRSQWKNCVAELRADPDSRRAIILINTISDNMKGGKDVPCTLSLQFFIRDCRLHLFVTMRSNDLVWGWTNDVFSFTLMQELMLMDLQSYPQFSDLELGYYHHSANSFHVYERHFDMIERALHQPVFDWGTMPPLTSNGYLDSLLVDERLLRTKEISTIDLLKYNGTLTAEGWMANQLNIHRSKRDMEEHHVAEPERADQQPGDRSLPEPVGEVP